MSSIVRSFSNTLRDESFFIFFWDVTPVFFGSGTPVFLTSTPVLLPCRFCQSRFFPMSQVRKNQHSRFIDVLALQIMFSLYVASLKKKFCQPFYSKKIHNFFIINFFFCEIICLKKRWKNYFFSVLRGFFLRYQHFF